MAPSHNHCVRASARFHDHTHHDERDPLSVPYRPAAGREQLLPSGRRTVSERSVALKIFVTGGAGYIGGAVAGELVAAGHDVVVFDDLSTGHADAVPAGARLVLGSLLDQQALRVALSAAVDAVLHFAGRSLVGESVKEPGLHWRNNVIGSRYRAQSPDRPTSPRRGGLRAGPRLCPDRQQPDRTGLTTVWCRACLLRHPLATATFRAGPRETLVGQTRQRVTTGPPFVSGTERHQTTFGRYPSTNPAGSRSTPSRSTHPLGHVQRRRKICVASAKAPLRTLTQAR